MKRKIILLISLILCASALICLSSCADMSAVEYLDLLEEHGEYMAVDELSYYFSYDKYKVSLQDIVEGQVVDVYCNYNGRIYFCYVTNQYAPAATVWNIASVDEIGEDFKLHRLHSIDRSESMDYTPLKGPREASIGGYYLDGKIYLKGDEYNFVYDIASDEDLLVNELPLGRYYIEFTTGTYDQDVIITDNESGVVRNIDLYDLEEGSPEYTEFYDRVDKMSLAEMMFSGKEILEEYVVINGELCSVYTFPTDNDRESCTAVFAYDFQSNKLVYRTHIISTVSYPRVVPVITDGR